MTKIHARESQTVRLKNSSSVYNALKKLKDLLNLKEPPRLLECYDVAIWQGKSPTAAKVVFQDGRALKKLYRYYHLQELPEGNNDYAMMKELLERRIKKDHLPDLFIIDGGLGQVNIVKKVLQEKNIAIPVVGIAKAKNLGEKKSEERLIIPGRKNPYILKKSPELFKLMVSMRDEAHRFSRRLHHKAESNRLMTSWLDQISGIGPKIKNHINKKMNIDLEELSTYSLKEICDYLAVSENVGRKIKNFLHQFKT